MPAAVLDVSAIGPVDVAVIRFDSDEFSDDVAPALSELDRNGTVHIIDLAFVRKEADDKIADELEPGSAAMVIVWENSWAARLAAALRGSHGQLVAQERIPRERVLRAIEALGEE